MTVTELPISSLGVGSAVALITVSGSVLSGLVSSAKAYAAGAVTRRKAKMNFAVLLRDMDRSQRLSLDKSRKGERAPDSGPGRKRLRISEAAALAPRNG